MAYEASIKAASSNRQVRRQQARKKQWIGRACMRRIDEPRNALAIARAHA